MNRNEEIKSTVRVTLIIRWFLRRWYRLRAVTVDRRKGVLVYVGMHKGREFNEMFRAYRECYGFEANPELFAILKEKYREFPNVKLFNVAAATTAGMLTFNISSNDGASSSLGNFDEAWDKYKSGEVRMVRSITVPGVNLYEFLREQGVNTIDDYVSDIQGMDLAVLTTLKPYINEGRIETITVETTLGAKHNIYRDLPDNSESGFRNLLGKNYRLVAMGFGILADYWFAERDESWWEMDCKWRRRSRLEKMIFPA